MKSLPHISKLIVDSILHRISDEDKSVLEAWISKDSANADTYNRIADSSYLQKKYDEKRELDYLSAFSNIQKSISKRKKHRIVHSFLRYAAVIFIPLFLCVFLFPLESDIEEKSADLFAEVNIGSSKARLFLEDGRVVNVSKSVADTIIHANDACITSNDGGIKYQSIDSKSTKLKYNTLVIPRGGEYHLELADGTIVWLNSDSKLRYPVDFNTDERRVFLSGEAYFEVAHNANKPFIVDVEDSQIKVLGTSFNVRAYDVESKVVATLVIGSVKMNTKSKNQVIMFPGEQCVVNENGDLDKRKVDVSLFTSWKDGRLKFKHQTLEEIMNTLYRWYDIEVVYENMSVKDIYYSGNVRRYDDFENVIKLLEMAGTIKCNVKGKKVYIKEIKR